MKKILSLILVFQFLTGCGSESASDQASVAEKRGETSGGIVETNERKERVGLETDAKVKDSLDNGDVNFAANRVSSKAGEANISVASTEPAKVSPQKNGVPAASRAFEAIKDSKTETLPQLDSFPTFPETVLVGDPGNSADVTGYGAVNYAYRIGKFEVTNIEYCEFLNKVAKSDRYRLYDRRMAGVHGGIMRSGRSGNYSYETRVGDGDKPVNYVTWESCARYANWLSNRGGDAVVVGENGRFCPSAPDWHRDLTGLGQEANPQPRRPPGQQPLNRDHLWRVGQQVRVPAAASSERDRGDVVQVFVFALVHEVGHREEVECV